MITFYNEGIAGRDYGYLTVDGREDCAIFQIEEKDREGAGTILNTDQIRFLRDRLSEWLGEGVSAPKSNIKGTAL